MLRTSQLVTVYTVFVRPIWGRGVISPPANGRWCGDELLHAPRQAEFFWSQPDPGPLAPIY